MPGQANASFSIARVDADPAAAAAAMAASPLLEGPPTASPRQGSRLKRAVVPSADGGDGGGDDPAWALLEDDGDGEADSGSSGEHAAPARAMAPPVRGADDAGGSCGGIGRFGSPDGSPLALRRAVPAQLKEVSPVTATATGRFRALTGQPRFSASGISSGIATPRDASPQPARLARQSEAGGGLTAWLARGAPVLPLSPPGRDVAARSAWDASDERPLASSRPAIGDVVSASAVAAMGAPTETWAEQRPRSGGGGLLRAALGQAPAHDEEPFYRASDPGRAAAPRSGTLPIVGSPLSGQPAMTTGTQAAFLSGLAHGRDASSRARASLAGTSARSGGADSPVRMRVTMAGTPTRYGW